MGMLEHARHVMHVQDVHPLTGTACVSQTCASQNFDAMQKLIDSLLADGFPAEVLAGQMLEFMLRDDLPAARAIPSAAKAKIAIQLAEVDKMLVDGADEYMQLTNLLAFTMRQLRAP